MVRAAALALDHPAVAAEPVRALDAAARDAGRGVAMRGRAGAAPRPRRRGCSQAPSAPSLRGRRRGRPRPRRTPGTASSAASSPASSAAAGGVPSCRLAPLEPRRRTACRGPGPRSRSRPRPGRRDGAWVARPPALRRVRADRRARRAVSSRAPPFAGMDAPPDRAPAPLERIRRGRPLEPRPGADRPAHPPRAAPAAGAGRSCRCGRTPRAAAAAGLCPSRAASTTPFGARRSRHRGRPSAFGASARRTGATAARRPWLAAHKRPGHGPRRRIAGWVLLRALSSTLAIQAAWPRAWAQASGRPRRHLVR